MRGRGRTVMIVAAIAGIAAVLAGAVTAGTRSSDEAALQPARKGADRGIERKVDALLAKMTLREKLQQIQLLSDGQVTDADARAVDEDPAAGLVGRRRRRVRVRPRPGAGVHAGLAVRRRRAGAEG